VRIDPDEIKIKRLLDHEVLKSASFIRSFETVIIIVCSMGQLTFNSIKYDFGRLVIFSFGRFWKKKTQMPIINWVN
jgi:hypothetical protein